MCDIVLALLSFVFLSALYCATRLSAARSDAEVQVSGERRVALLSSDASHKSLFEPDCVASDSYRLAETLCVYLH